MSDELKKADPVGEREGEPIYLVATGSDGSWSSLFRESALKQGVHDVMCTCKRTWGNCESEGVPATVRLLDEPTEWIGHEPFPRFSWGQNFEDGYIDVTRITDTATLASEQSAEGIPVKRLAVNVGIHGETMNEAPQGAYVLWSEHAAIISANEAEIARLKASEEWKSSIQNLLFALGMKEEMRGSWGGNIEGWGAAFEWIKYHAKHSQSAQAELSALKLSSARIEEETLRKAAGIGMAYDMPRAPEGSNHNAYNAALREYRDRILSLIPTSPESQKEGE